MVPCRSARSGLLRGSRRATLDCVRAMVMLLRIQTVCIFGNRNIQPVCPCRRRPDRGDATRDALVAAARALFAERGYAGVGTEEIVRRAGVTRGALYHHFRTSRTSSGPSSSRRRRRSCRRSSRTSRAVADPMDELATGVRAFLDACGDPTLMRIGLRDAPGRPRLGGVARDRQPPRPRARHRRPGRAMDEGQIVRTDVRSRSRTCSSPRSPRRRS